MLAHLVEGQTRLCEGRYRFLHQIGAGTFAVILKALDSVTHSIVAIKCMQHPELNILGEREASILKSIHLKSEDHHVAVVHLLHVFYEQDHMCLVMECLGRPVVTVRSKPLVNYHGHRHKLYASLVPSRKNRSFPFTLPTYKPQNQPVARESSSSYQWNVSTLRTMVVHICGALALLHDQGFIHADLKPENVLHVVASDHEQLVKIVDFGNCIDHAQIPLYEDDFAIQTPAYRAPEVAAGLLLSTAMDMWSLGCILVEYVTHAPLVELEASNSIEEQAVHQQVLVAVEQLMTNGKPLTTICRRYHQARMYQQHEPTKKKKKKITHSNTISLVERLERAVPSDASLQSFLMALLHVDPLQRLSARQALFHPFVQAFFPFHALFGTIPPPMITSDVEDPTPTNKKKKKKQINASPTTTTNLREALQLIASTKPKPTTTTRARRG